MLHHCEEGQRLRSPVKERLSQDVESVGDCWDEDLCPTCILEKFSVACCTSFVRTLWASHFCGPWHLQCLSHLLLVGLGVLRVQVASVYDVTGGGWPFLPLLQCVHCQNGLPSLQQAIGST